MMIPGFIISILTFPGVIVHELAHQCFCRWMKVPVFEVKYFQFSNPSGYVLHERTENPWKTFFISMGPFFVNTILGMLILFPASIEIFKFKLYTNPINIVLAWLGISILMHSFPSTGDAKVMVENILKNKEVNLVAKIVTAPFIGLVYVGALGSMIWLDLLYAVAMAMVLPNFIAALMML